MKSIRVFSSPESMAEEIARHWCEKAKQNAKEELVFTVVLSGGNTASLLYSKLAQPEWRDQIPWETIHIFFADERCVPPNNYESNYKNIYDILLKYISIPEKNIHRIKGEKNPEKEAPRYANEINDHLSLRKGDTNYFDWVLLGVGVDGHTASLFPDQNIITSSKLCETARHPETGQFRITLTPYAIKKATSITYHVVGESKSNIIHELTSNPFKKNRYPASQIEGEWFLDKEAASRLYGGTRPN